MNTISLKVPEALAIRLEEAARRRGIGRSKLIRDAVESYLQTDDGAHSGSALSQAIDLAGVVAGPEDLSTDPAYLRKFGR